MHCRRECMKVCSEKIFHLHFSAVWIGSCGTLALCTALLTGRLARCTRTAHSFIDYVHALPIRELWTLIIEYGSQKPVRPWEWDHKNGLVFLEYSNVTYIYSKQRLFVNHWGHLFLTMGNFLRVLSLSVCIVAEEGEASHYICLSRHVLWQCQTLLLWALWQRTEWVLWSWTESCKFTSPSYTLPMHSWYQHMPIY